MSFQEVSSDSSSAAGAEWQPDALAQSLTTAALTLQPQLIALRRELHRYPELAFDEVRTAQLIANALRDRGMTVRGGIGKTGLVVDIDGGQKGKTLLIRADMDALPIQEINELAWRSERPGLMHACGHDLHCATLLGVGMLLYQRAPVLKGRVRLMFQPAEETFQGAAAMIADGVLAQVDYVLGFHNRPSLDVGRFGVMAGATTASSDRFEIVIEGEDGHSARPFQARSALVAGAQLVMQIQAIVGNEIDPLDACAVALGSFQSGHAANIIPGQARLQGTVRARSETARQQAAQTLRRLCLALEQSHRVTCRLDYQQGVPAAVNDIGLTALADRAVRAQFGAVIDPVSPGMGGEDFALLSERVPGFRLHVGSSQPGRHDRVHTSDYQPDEGCIVSGVAALTRIALAILDSE